MRLMAVQSGISPASKEDRRSGYQHEWPLICKIKEHAAALAIAENAKQSIGCPVCTHVQPACSCIWEQMTVSRQWWPRPTPSYVNDVIDGQSQQKASLQASGSSSRA